MTAFDNKLKTVAQASGTAINKLKLTCSFLTEKTYEQEMIKEILNTRINRILQQAYRSVATDDDKKALTKNIRIIFSPDANISSKKNREEIYEFYTKYNECKNDIFQALDVIGSAFYGTDETEPLTSQLSRNFYEYTLWIFNQDKKLNDARHIVDFIHRLNKIILIEEKDRNTLTNKERAELSDVEVFLGISEAEASMVGQLCQAAQNAPDKETLDKLNKIYKVRHSIALRTCIHPALETINRMVLTQDDMRIRKMYNELVTEADDNFGDIPITKHNNKHGAILDIDDATWIPEHS